MPALEAPIGIIACDPLPHPLVADTLEEPASDDLADLSLVVCEQIARHAAHNPGDPLLPQLIGICHFDLAARQANHGGCSRDARGRYCQVLDEGIEAFSHAAVAVDEIEHLIQQQQHRGIRYGEDPTDCLGAGRRRHRSGTERLNTSLVCDLPSEIDPWRLTSRLRVPCIADEHPDASGGSRSQSCRIEQLRNARKVDGAWAGVGEVIERRQGMCLSTAELSHQRQHWRGISRLAGQSAKHHARVLGQCAREAGSRKELLRSLVIVGSGAGDHLFERDSELIGAERAPLAHLATQRNVLVPRVHGRPTSRARRLRSFYSGEKLRRGLLEPQLIGIGSRQKICLLLVVFVQSITQAISNNQVAKYCQSCGVSLGLPERSFYSVP